MSYWQVKQGYLVIFWIVLVLCDGRCTCCNVVYVILNTCANTRLHIYIVYVTVVSYIVVNVVRMVLSVSSWRVRIWWTLTLPPSLPSEISTSLVTCWPTPSTSLLFRYTYTHNTVEYGTRVYTDVCWYFRLHTINYHAANCQCTDPPITQQCKSLTQLLQMCQTFDELLE